MDYNYIPCQERWAKLQYNKPFLSLTGFLFCCSLQSYNLPDTNCVRSMVIQTKTPTRVPFNERVVLKEITTLTES